MRYALERYKQKKRDDLYRIYVTDALRMITENTAYTAEASSHGNVSSPYLVKRYIDIAEPRPEKDAPAPGSAKKRILEKFDM